MTRVLIISVNAIGDTYLSASAIEPLRRHLDASRIRILAHASAAFMMPYLDADEVDYLQARSAGGLFAALRKLREERFDFVFSFFPGRANTILFRGAKGNSKAGFTNIRPLPRWHDLPARVSGRGISGAARTWEPSMSFLERIRIVLEACGIPAPRLDKVRFANLPGTDLSAPDVILHPCSKDPDKSMSAETIQALIAALLERDRRVLLIGSEGEPLEYDFDPDRCARRIDPPLPELVALIRSCASYIGVDSFPLHIADVYRPDFAGLFAPTAPGSALQRPEMGVRYPYPSLQSVPPAEILAGLERYLLPGEEEQQ